MTTFVAQTRDLTKRFGAQVSVDHVNLAVERGTVYGLLGPNGAGKTTTLKLLLGLLSPSGGRVDLFERPWSRGALTRVGALIEAPALYAHLSGTENLLVHAGMLGLPAARVHDVLRQVGLADAANKRAGQYSLGMKQRLGLGIALLNAPEFLILDEPTNGLDPVGIVEMRELIRDLPQQGITVLVSSHLLAEVSQMATHVGVIDKGRVKYEGPLDALLARKGGRLELTVANAARVWTALAASRPDLSGGRVEGERLLIPVEAHAAASVIAAVVNAGFDVRGLAYFGDDLESAFLDLIDAPSPNFVSRPEVLA
ncbi:ATP-binding cassette domain-containing protein [Deinococcus yavapaiensis]|uniref:Gallidermin-class lantibiotic protection ABC transporter ATP-binding subunit n=1 Tax=Deinococcus yavapaiensis KR-236 TaxID=694435 RepID=A0A318SLM3_9DEIO|nr:ATP-binding cassette domain-containing protein [Deinococcus yavapaiensis]PYE53382.1 gallidermin-class lantibiotic protection ABC transporter ATP-binding subunit [Deinococcus yavapaiensis KR-236]